MTQFKRHELTDCYADCSTLMNALLTQQGCLSVLILVGNLQHALWFSERWNADIEEQVIAEPDTHLILHWCKRVSCLSSVKLCNKLNEIPILNKFCITDFCGVPAHIHLTHIGLINRLAESWGLNHAMQCTKENYQHFILFYLFISALT